MEDFDPPRWKVAVQTVVCLPLLILAFVICAACVAIGAVYVFGPPAVRRLLG